MVEFVMKSNPHIVFVVGQAAHQQKYAHSLSKGMAKHNHTNIQIVSHFDFNSYPDLIVTWAHKRESLYSHQKKRLKPYLIMERAYVGDRHNWVSLGYNGLNGRADFCNHNIVSLDRWNKHFSDKIKPWKINKDGYILVIGQVPGDKSHAHININQWYESTITKLLNDSHRIVFRKHPLDKSGSFYFPGLSHDQNENLETSLENAKCCVTFSSNSAVISVLNGIPTVAIDQGSMAYSVASHDLSNLQFTPDRSSWAAKLAWTQWLPYELENGDAWNHLKQKL